MSTLEAHSLEEAIRQAGEGWLIDLYSPRADAVSHLLRTLDAVGVLAREPLGGDAPDFSERAIMAEFERRPAQVRGFFQALGGSRTPEMLLMVRRIIQGMEIKRIQLAYEHQRSFEATVIFSRPMAAKMLPTAPRTSATLPSSDTSASWR